VNSLWLTLQRLSTQLESPVGGNGHYARARQGLRITVGGVDGPPGIGECSPLPGYSPDSLFSCERALSDACFEDVTSADLGELKQAVSLSASELPAARHALETALVDRSARRIGLSAAHWLAAAVGQQPRPSVTLAALISAETPEKLVMAARGAIAAGYGTLKVKLGPAEQWEKDKLRLGALRNAIGSAARLRLDVNRAWTLAQAHLLQNLVEFDPEFVEEPFEAGALEQLDGSPVPLALDESLQQRYALDHFAPHLPRLNVGVVVLKPMALGGMARCIRMAARARLMGMHVVISHLFDGPIALSAAGALALAIGSQEYAQGIAPHPALLLDPLHGVRHVRGGRLWSTDEPGLALDREEAPCSA
jgi:o-succinylbenzoate synthase